MLALTTVIGYSHDHNMGEQEQQIKTTQGWLPEPCEASTFEGYLRFYELQIIEETERALDRIKKIDEQKITQSWITSFGDMHLYEDYVARRQAMIEVFAAFDLTEAYFSPAQYPNLAQKKDKGARDWELRLQRPDGMGAFRVAYEHANAYDKQGNPLFRQTLYYNRRWSA